MPPARLAELVGAFSTLTALADGFPADKALRTATLATALARHAGWAPEACATVYYTGALRFAGCTGFAVEDTALNAGDDIGLRRTMATADVADPPAFVAQVQSGIGAHLPADARAATLAGLLADPGVAVRHARAQCDAAVRIARRFGVDGEVLRALDQKEERWDGRGIPDGVGGEALSPVIRVVAVADLAEIQHRAGGRNGARTWLRHQRGAWLAPDVVDLFLRHADTLWPLLEEPGAWTRFLDAEPAPRRPVGALLPMAEAIAAFVDLKSAWFVGHSAEVARVAAAAAPALGLDPARVHIAGLLHDVGRAAISNLVWDKPGPLDPLDQLAAESHVRITADVLRLSPSLTPFLPAVAGVHAPRPGPAEAALLAAADTWCALRSARPYRPARSPTDAAAVLEADARAGRLDGGVVAAVLAAERARPGRAVWPAGLTRREVEVLRLISRGLATKEIATTLELSPKTVERHVTRLYATIGVGSRAAATLWAMEQGLLGDLPQVRA